MIAILWRYAVRPEHAAAFEAAYGPAGDWARLFATAPGYLGTELLAGHDGDYLTLDRWTDHAAWQAFMVAHDAAYQALDRRFERLTEAEERLGVFQLLA